MTSDNRSSAARRYLDTLAVASSTCALVEAAQLISTSVVNPAHAADHHQLAAARLYSRGLALTYTVVFSSLLCEVEALFGEQGLLPLSQSINGLAKWLEGRLKLPTELPTELPTPT